MYCRGWFWSNRRGAAAVGMANGFLIAGLFLILIASEVILRGAVGVARQFDIPPLYTGIFVIGLLTVLPELVITIRAAELGHADLAVGGLIGTSLFDLLFVLGLGALIHPMASPPKIVFRDGGALLIAGLGLLAAMVSGTITRWEGFLLLAGFAAYLALVLITDWRRAPDHSVPLARALFRSEGEMPSLTGAFFFVLIGLIGLGLGTHLGLLGAVHLAGELGWSESTVGLLLIAAGLSSPKLLVTLVAAVRGETAIAVGQLLGACVFNLTAVLGLTALIHPLVLSPSLVTDSAVLAAAGLIVLPVLAMRWRLSRPRGVLLLIAYGCYVGVLLVRQGLPPLPWGP